MVIGDKAGWSAASDPGTGPLFVLGGVWKFDGDKDTLSGDDGGPDSASIDLDSCDGAGMMDCCDGAGIMDCFLGVTNWDLASAGPLGI